MTPTRRGTNPNLERAFSGNPEEIGSTINGVIHWTRLDKVETDEDCWARIEQFMRWHVENNQFPTVEKLCLQLGVTKQTLQNWEHGHGCTERRAQMIQQAKTIFAAIDAELAAKGFIEKTVYIFRSKNFYDMHDNVEIVATAKDPMGDMPDRDQLLAKYTAQLPAQQNVVYEIPEKLPDVIVEGY